VLHENLEVEMARWQSDLSILSLDHLPKSHKARKWAAVCGAENSLVVDRRSQVPVPGHLFPPTLSLSLVEVSEEEFCPPYLLPAISSGSLMTSLARG